MTGEANAAAADDPEPQAPRAPEPGECCQSGCETCVYDVYWAALERYEQALREWQGRHTALRNG